MRQNTKKKETNLFPSAKTTMVKRRWFLELGIKKLKKRFFLYFNETIHLKISRKKIHSMKKPFEAEIR